MVRSKCETVPRVCMFNPITVDSLCLVVAVLYTVYSDIALMMR